MSEPWPITPPQRRQIETTIPVVARPDYETMTGQFPDNRTGNLLVLQSHAFLHFTNRCSGTIPNPPLSCDRQMACPICGKVKGFNKFTEDHCPQRGGQSRFGTKKCVVLTCSECNSERSGDTFERQSAAVQNGLKAASLDAITALERPSGLWVAQDRYDSTQLLTDLKAAFLIAFATLGYAFAFHSTMDATRDALYRGLIPPNGGPGPPGEQPFTVTETDTTVAVEGEDLVWNFKLKESDESISQLGKSYAWPENAYQGSTYHHDSLRDDGNLFHADFCNKPSHHRWQ